MGTAKLAHTTIRQRQEVELGYAFTPEVWGRGYATEAGGAVLDFAGNVLGLDQVVAFALIGNAPSFAVMRRLRFSPDGTFERPAGRHALTARHCDPTPSEVEPIHLDGPFEDRPAAERRSWWRIDAGSMLACRLSSPPCLLLASCQLLRSRRCGQVRSCCGRGPKWTPRMWSRPIKSPRSNAGMRDR